jgi:hypothetical protein
MTLEQRARYRQLKEYRDALRVLKANGHLAGDTWLQTVKEVRASGDRHSGQAMHLADLYTQFEKVWGSRVMRKAALYAKLILEKKPESDKIQ